MERRGRGPITPELAILTPPRSRVALSQPALVEEVLADPGRMRPVFQPLMSLRTGEVVGHELLTRFDAPPETGEWFAHARRVGLGAELEVLALRTGLNAAQDPCPACALSVNLGPTALAHPSLDRVLPDDLHGLIVEVTEHELVVEYQGLRPVLDHLRARGARIAIDDAGTGYAGLRQLVELRPDVVKLDMGLVAGIDTDPAKATLVEALVRFADARGALVCAEGIETLGELQALASLDVDLGQGFAIAAPGPGRPEIDPDALVACASALDPQVNPRSVFGMERIGARLAQARGRADVDAVLPELLEVLGADAVRLLGPEARAPESSTLLLEPVLARGKVVAQLEVRRQDPRPWRRVERSRIRLAAALLGGALPS